jgi:dihydrofolate reductase
MSIKNISIIVAATKYGAIGSNNSLPWKCPEDMRWFKRFTTGKNIVMGANTALSLGSKPLPNRTNWVIDCKPTEPNPFAEFNESTFQGILEEAKKNPDEEYVIIGGAKTYEKFIGVAKKLYITTIKDACIDKSATMDTFIPHITSDYKLQGTISTSEQCTIKCFVRD